MAVVLPQGRLNNSSDKQIREFIAENCRILGVVGLHGIVFKPHTGTKTSVLLVQKWNDDETQGALCPKLDDYPIFFATMQQPSKDSSGDKIFVKNSDNLPSPFGRGAGGEGGVGGDSVSEKSINPPLTEDIKTYARQMRHQATDAESFLWSQLRDRRLNNAKFRRQHPLERFILDFYCHELKIAIELDGGQHAEEKSQARDSQRDAFLAVRGIKTLRYWNNDVLNNSESVLQDIWQHAHLTINPTLTPNPSPEGRGEYLLDTHGHLIVKHDLFNHDGLTQDGIAEAFTEFAKKERLSFFQ